MRLLHPFQLGVLATACLFTVACGTPGANHEEFAPAALVPLPADTLPPEVAVLAEPPVFTPHHVDAAMQDTGAFLSNVNKGVPRAMRSQSPPYATTVTVLIDAEGIVQKACPHQSSGSAVLDRAVENAVRSSRFSPAILRYGRGLKKERDAPVWTRISVVWKAGEPRIV